MEQKRSSNNRHGYNYNEKENMKEKPPLTRLVYGVCANGCSRATRKMSKYIDFAKSSRMHAICVRAEDIVAMKQMTSTDSQRTQQKMHKTL